MPTYALNFFDLALISTDDPQGFSDNGGYQFDLGVSTVTIREGATSHPVSILDAGDTTFDDDAGNGQVLNGAHVLNGIAYGDRTIIESEYEIDVQDSQGTIYTLQFVSLGNDAWNVNGFVIQGDAPPFGEPLTVVGRHDATQGVHQYSTSTAPACFAGGTRIATPSGWRRVEDLRRGDLLRCHGGGTVALAFVMRRAVRPTGHRNHAPVRLRAHALGPGLPRDDLILSPHHRVLWRNGGEEVLLPARALTELRRVGLVPGRARVEYFHLVTRGHSILLAEAVPCESFWPGDWMARTLSPGMTRRLARYMGPDARPARRLLSMREARQLLRGGGHENAGHGARRFESGSVGRAQPCAESTGAGAPMGADCALPLADRGSS
ncbi:Hint domain-containing protein [Salipiger sp.]|uniref:Hint domain-containing protein n=1 Tax=Salipiger sp. TaxID=2078585 RepID=UPI003A97504B